MICIGIPVCRPLYRRVFGTVTSRGSKYQHQPIGLESGGVFAKRTIGGSTIKGLAFGRQSEGLHKKPSTGEQEDEHLSLNEYKLGGTMPYHSSYIKAMGASQASNNSEDGILDPVSGPDIASRQSNGDTAPSDGIRVTSKWHVSSNHVSE